MVSIGYEDTKRKGKHYLTRAGIVGDLGLDHYMRNKAFEACVETCGIDKHSIHLNVHVSNHHLLHLDLNINFNWEDSEAPTFIRTMFGRVYSIPVRAIKEGDAVKKFAFDSKKIGEELEADDDFQILSKFRHIMETETKPKELKESAKSMRDKIEKSYASLGEK